MFRLKLPQSALAMSPRRHLVMCQRSCQLPHHLGHHRACLATHHLGHHRACLATLRQKVQQLVHQPRRVLRLHCPTSLASVSNPLRLRRQRMSLTTKFFRFKTGVAFFREAHSRPTKLVSRWEMSLPGSCKTSRTSQNATTCGLTMFKLQWRDKSYLSLARSALRLST